MFEQLEENEPAKKGPPDYTGTLIGALMLPVFFSFVYLGKAEMGFTVALVLGVIMIAIKLRWKLRKHVWFWCAIGLVMLLNVPLIFVARWPQSNVPTIAYSMPFGIIDFLLVSGAIGVAERLFSKDSASEGE
jgi:hypothetical protein